MFFPIFVRISYFKHFLNFRIKATLFKIHVNQYQKVSDSYKSFKKFFLKMLGQYFWQHTRVWPCLLQLNTGTKQCIRSLMFYKIDDLKKFWKFTGKPLFRSLIPRCCSCAFIVNFKHISHFILVFLLLTLSR